MDEFIKLLDILNKYSSLILVLATAIYVGFTIILAKETRKLREVETSPFISIELLPFSDMCIGLKVKNIGKAPAYNITFEIDKKYEDFFSLSYDKKINYFSPGQKFECYGKSLKELRDLGIDNIPIKTKYFSKDKLKYEETFYIEWSSLGGRLINKKPIEEIEKHLEKIYKELEKNNKLYENKNRCVVPRIGLVKIEKTDFYLKCIFSDGFIGKIEKNKVKDFGLNSFESIYLFDGKLRDDSIRIIIQTEELYTKLKKKTIKERHLKTFF